MATHDRKRRQDQVFETERRRNKNTNSQFYIVFRMG